MEIFEAVEPYKHLLIFAGIGIVAGWLAGKILGGGGLIRNLFVGILGAIVGGMLVKLELLPIPTVITDITDLIPFGLGTEIFVATVGALLVVLIARILIR